MIHSVFGYSFLEIPDVVRIGFYGENVRPDFNLSDYAFTYDWLEFGDRHYRAPNFVLYDAFQDLVAGNIPPPMEFEDRKFCNFIYSNGACDPMRELVYEQLARIGPIDSLGSYKNNTPRPPSFTKGKAAGWDFSKVEIQRNYRFSIVVENSSSPGYTSEKIVHAIAANTIPIYYGDPLVDRVFNPHRIINVHTLGLEGAAELVRKLNNDPMAYAAMLAQPAFAAGSVPRELTQEGLLDAFERIFSRPKAQALRRNPHVWGPKYEARHRVAFLPVRDSSKAE